jgi:hypothetical protein
MSYLFEAENIGGREPAEKQKRGSSTDDIHFACEHCAKKFKSDQAR